LILGGDEEITSSYLGGDEEITSSYLGGDEGILRFLISLGRWSFL
jgi:hypothetical protein